MMKKVLYLRLLLAIFAFMESLPIFAYDIAVKNAEGVTIYYNWINDRTELAVTCQSWGGYSGNVVIPESVEYSGKTYSVTSIGYRAFYECGLTSITIPSSIYLIDEDAFRGCGDMNVYISDISAWCNIRYVIGEGFKGARRLFLNGKEIRDLVIPDDVTVIGPCAFYNCSGLTSVTIPSSVTCISIDAFSGCSGLTSVTIPNSVTSIYDRAFSGCSGLKTIVSEIKNPFNINGVFSDDTYNVAELIVPKGTKALYQATEGWNQFSKITEADDVSQFTDNGIYYRLKSGGTLEVTGLVSWTTVAIVIPEKVTYVGREYSVTSIGYEAFMDCSDLTFIRIPNSVTSIGNSAFSWCTGLTSVTIPNSVNIIGRSAFYNCSSLISVISEILEPFKIENNVFNNIPSNAELIVPKGTKATYQATEGWNKFSKITEADEDQTFTDNGIYYNIKSDGTLEVTGLASWTTRADIPSSLTIDGSKYRVTSIGESAFEGRSDITYLSIQYSMKSIGKNAFRDCGNSMTVNIANLDAWCKMELGNEHSSPLSSAGKVLLYDVEATSINIPETVTSIGKYTFYQCKSITSLSIPSSVTSIGSSAFEDCTGLKSVTLSKGLTSIGGSSFEGCKGLTSITIPSTVTSIALNAFKDCTNLNTITSEIRNPFAINENVFSTYSTATLIVPAGTKSAYQNTAGWNKFAKIIENSSGVDNPDYPNQYLTFVARERGSFSFNGTSSNNVDNSFIYYSLDEGSSWTALARNVQSPTIQAGERIMFKGTLTPLYHNVEGAEAIIGIGRFSSTGRFDVEGNIMSILYGDDFIGQKNLTGKNFAFYELFLNCTSLISAENLVLPATKLADSSYEGMFRSCTSLTTAPQLPATTLANSCYEGMFYDCSSLITAPQLPATSLGVSSYCYMFGACTSLTIAPQLPATTLVDMCYRYMFSGCTSLTIAPQLPATTLTSKCYEYMFNNCTNLKEITCLATDISASECTYNWVRNVPSSGTFIKSSSMNSWTRGIDGIPTNWTIQNDNGTKADELTDNGFTFSVDTSSLTAEVISFDQSRSNVSIPETVTYNGTIYRVTSIGNFAFYQCRNITSVTIPSSVTSIGSSAFEDCTGLISITLSKGLTSIGGSSFEGCTGLTSITIPSTVTSIAINAYKNCTGLNTIISEIQNPFAINENVFSTYSTATLNVPAGTKSAYQNTAGWNKFQNIVEVGGEQSVVLTALSYSREYGEANPAFEYMVDGENLNGTPTISCDATKTSPVGTYAIKISNGSVTNSNVSYIDGTLTITTAPLTVTAKDYSREQGQANPTFEVTYSGFKNNETESVLTQKPTASTTATVNSVPGQYDITVSGGEAQNYSFIYNKGVLTVTEKDEVLFAIDGITYQGTKSAKTVVVTSVDKSQTSLEIPASVSYDGTTYQVSGITDGIFDGSNMAALIWNVEAALPNNAFNNASIGSNFLLYVKSSNYAPSSVKNVVVNGSASVILLSDDGGQFYCPQAFTARNISYTHNYSMETGGNGKGWETIALPFDVQKITHSTRGEIVPFPAYNSSSNQKPFWLGNFSGSAFRRTSGVLANEPYIIAMPNSSNYRNEYNLAGDVTFSAENVQVPKTPTFSGTFVPAFAPVSQSSNVYALNVSNRYVKYSGAYDAGSRFIKGLRDIRPFEAYINTSSTRGVIEINFDDDTTDINDILISANEDDEVTVHILSGQQIARTSKRDFDAVWQLLPKGVYIVNGKKMIK